ncbi:MAG: PilZ domain-containing protein [Proteobacteria bacterium]|nr:PilZ domain-containing protein [Pseudomonadota bacterium]
MLETATSPASPAPQLRGADRSSLLLRIAKLVTQSGEYVCLVRDVSWTGLRLRLFHELPDETFVFLQLANGEIYPVEKIWTKGDQAGFRFAEPVDVSEFISEPSPWPRRPIRLKIEAPGLAFVGSTAISVNLKDLSQGGARVEAFGHLMIGQPLRLLIDGLPERWGRVSWRRGFDHGMAFEHQFRLDELAAHALTLQPLKPAGDKADARYA